MVPHSTIRRVLLPQLAALSISPNPYCQSYALKSQVTTEVATSFAHYKTRYRKFWSVHPSLLSYSSCLVAPPVFLPGSRQHRLYTCRKNSRLVFPLHFVVGYVAYCPTEHRLRKNPENGRSRFHPMKGTVSDLSGSPTESFKGLWESGKDSI